MLADIASSPDTIMVAPAPPGDSTAGSVAHDTSSPESPTEVKPTPIANAANFPPPKTDKPRPHVCGTCGRSFARLEHLKRHERSHTKEKPFECPQCTRCFARRDLLLRHQQKLHQTGTTSSRPRNSRRESTTGVPVASGRVRKNSVASTMQGSSNAGASSARPRANTISHIDGSMLSELVASANASAAGGSMHTSHGHHNSISGFSPGTFDYRGLSQSLGHHGLSQGLPKIDTHMGLGLGGGGLRTAPIQSFGDPFDIDKLFGSGSTINPAQLHFPGNAGTPHSPFSGMPFTAGSFEEEEKFNWNAGLDGPMLFNGNENPVDGSSPSAISTASQSGFSEVMLDGSNNHVPASTEMWHHPLTINSMVGQNSSFGLEAMGPVFPELMNSIASLSPKELPDVSSSNDFYLSSPPPLTAMSPTAGIPGMPSQYFHPQMNIISDNTSVSSSSINGSVRQSSVTSVSTDSITDTTRQTLLLSLSQATAGGAQRKYSQPSISSPLSPATVLKHPSISASIPSTADLQRYVNAYVLYFHPHLPFLHIPTLNFDAPAFTNLSQNSAHSTFSQDGTAGGGSSGGVGGGGGCLILAMAAIGALYEFEHQAGRELFEAAKKLIMFYLDGHRKAGLTAALSGPAAHEAAMNQAPLWLVQAMLLNLIYGHTCGDKQAAEVASTHCAALVSLAKAAGLDKSMSDHPHQRQSPIENMDQDVVMGDDGAHEGKGDAGNATLHSQWIRWKTQEERKRTFYAIYILSSLLVTAYGHPPRILNSEIRLDLPCEEDVWMADSAQTWATVRGASGGGQNNLAFSSALTYLLEASLRRQADEQPSYPTRFGSSASLDESSEAPLRPSTFGCYVLIHALHVYIWDTRQRHTSRHWKAEETDAMHAQIEPALRAWQAAWGAHPHHSLERHNPYGPLAADSIPLLDLAYVRLFVNLGRSKEAFWQRDFDAMAEELAKGNEFVQSCSESPEGSGTGYPSGPATSSQSPGDMMSPQGLEALNETSPENLSNAPTTIGLQSNQSSKREKHLRKAAFYAADSLSMADRLGVTFTDFTARELPIQSAMCTFDCAQVLAEWVATVQERVGRFLGILGRDDVDFTQVPAIMLLEEEDIKLLHKISDILTHADMKMTYEMGNMSSPTLLPLFNTLSNLSNYGFGSKLLLITAYMLEKSAVWPITHVMARALEAHASHMTQRAEASLSS